ncbi:alpha/beta fold hydrolase [Piscinibacter sp. XHJ-5]|uniref:dienelactone hydrolase family protein n=1 Tax=Piscinibacter sp. XHJ-5 TaxID=3037797 RepID=UPI002452CBC1|nr:alpha/beta fold hydrolase [Piscinibacter sp. XHJ-5]
MSDDVKAVEIPPHGLQGLLGVPAQARGIVLFAHGSGSGRLSPRNQRVATALRRAGIATLLLDLLTEDEENDRANVFDIELLAQRLGEATDWVHLNADTALLPLGYFGASTGAGAALMAAAQPRHRPAAIVSRGGRPDLAGDALEEVRAPTLLIVGSHDPQVLELNRRAMARMRSEKVLSIVPGATHLFEEPGTLDEVTRLATAWFHQHLGPG